MQPIDKDPGLCGSCVHARVVESDRGSRFWLCRAAASRPSMPKYPPLPVRRCDAFEPAEPEGREPRTDPFR